MNTNDLMNVKSLDQLATHLRAALAAVELIQGLLAPTARSAPAGSTQYGSQSADILAALADGPMTTGQVAAKLGSVSPGNVSSLLTQLLHRGKVTRKGRKPPYTYSLVKARAAKGAKQDARPGHGPDFAMRASVLGMLTVPMSPAEVYERLRSQGHAFHATNPAYAIVRNLKIWAKAGLLVREGDLYRVARPPDRGAS
jgi:hypothetical protein